jgi:hypothetical protein
MNSKENKSNNRKINLFCGFYSFPATRFRLRMAAKAPASKAKSTPYAETIRSVI